METHYVYGINDPVTKEFYFGVRTCEGSPDDDSYMGSYKSWKPEDESRLEKRVLRDDFATREEANQYERDLLIIYIDDELNRNAYIHGVGFCYRGNTHSRETRQRMSKKKRGENNNFFGKTHSKETIELLRKPKTTDHKKKVSQTRIEKGIAIGENNGRAKLTTKEVKEIRRLYSIDKYTHRQLAKIFGVSKTQITRILNNRSWTT